MNSTPDITLPPAQVILRALDLAEIMLGSECEEFVFNCCLHDAEGNIDRRSLSPEDLQYLEALEGAIKATATAREFLVSASQ